jgi:protein phosphatase
VVVNNDPSPACQRLVDLAKERGGHDNITVGIVSLKPLLDGTPKPVRETRVREAPL